VPSILSILPEGTVRDETTFLILLAGLAVLVGAAIYLRIRRKREEESPR
jgi:LPXTG-motif cell wall-anchored protein